MDIVVIVLMALEVLWLLWVLTHAAVPEMPGAREKLRSKSPDSIAALVMLTGVFLLVLAIIGICLRDSGWQLALMFVSFEPVLLYLIQGFAFDGVRYGDDGFALRDGLGRVRTFRWAEVQGVEKLEWREKHGWRPFTAVYLPGMRLCFDRDVGLPFLRVLQEKRGQLPANRPETGFFRGRVFNEPFTEGGMLLAVALGMAVAGTAEGGNYVGLWALPVLWLCWFAAKMYVGRKFDRMPSWVQRLFFMEDPYRRKRERKK